MSIKFNCLIFLIISASFFVNETTLNSIHPFDTNKDVSIIANVLHDIVDEYFVKENIPFDIYVFKNYEWISIDIINKFMKNADSKFAEVLYFHKYVRNRRGFEFLFYSVIFFLQSIDDVINLEEFYFPIRFSLKPIRYFIFIPGLTYEQLKNSELLNVFNQLFPFADFMFQYEYFIINEPETVTLATAEWFSAEKCGGAHLKKLNVFNKISRKWTTKLVNHEKFLQYHGCELTLMSPVFYKIIHDTSNYVKYTDDKKNIKFDGIVPVIFKIASKFHNFTDSYSPVNISVESMNNLNIPDYRVYEVNNTVKMPHVYFYVRSLIGYKFFKERRSNAFVDLNYFIAVTPAEAYTPYEKLLLPFDLETWILLSITFFMTFLSIFFINLLSKSTQAIVYGHRVDTPFWNVISIFFGISQTRLPNKNFSRFILILFVFFCLIFRTCFQSKLFEFMTSEPRRPPPKTIEDLIDNNYTMYLAKENNLELEFIDSDGRRLRQQEVKLLGFDELFHTQTRNASAKMALYAHELFQNYMEQEYSLNYEWIKFKDPYTVSHETFVYPQLAFYFLMINNMINRLIDTGIIKYLSDNYYTRKHVYVKLNEPPKVLCMTDMAFGFNIYLGFCGISLVMFILEILAYRCCLRRCKKSFTNIKLRKRKIRFAKVHPTKKIIPNKPTYTLNSSIVDKFRIKTNHLSTAEIQT